MRVGLIDDDTEFHYIFRRILSEKPEVDEIVVFNNGKEALDFFRSGCPGGDLDLIFLDIGMPVMDGFEFLDHYQELKDELGERLFIMLTSSSDPGDVTKALKYTAVREFVTKPPTAEALEAAWEKVRKK